MRVCVEPGCPVLCDGRRCPRHQTEYEQRRGSAASRGYGSAHNARRKALELTVNTGTVLCWRCNQPIRIGEPWDLGHDDHDRTRYKGPEHANRCNRAAGGRAAHTT